jgi:hypothetical protein
LKPGASYPLPWLDAFKLWVNWIHRVQPHLGVGLLQRDDAVSVGGAHAVHPSEHAPGADHARPEPRRPEA